MNDRTRLPAGLPVPEDDGAADHLTGRTVPALDLIGLPAFEAGGATLYWRITLIIRDGAIEHVFYPIFPPNEHARQVLRWLADNPA